MKDAVGSIVEQVTEVGDLLQTVLASATTPDPDHPEQGRCDQHLGSVDEQLRDLLVGLETVRNATEAAQAAVMVQMGARARVADQGESAATGSPLWTHQRREQFVPDEIGWLKEVVQKCNEEAAQE